jgi:hypothetical protein
MTRATYSARNEDLRLLLLVIMCVMLVVIMRRE